METTYKDTTTTATSTAVDQPLWSALHPAMSSRSIVAGVLITLLTFSILFSLGIAIGGVSLTPDTTAQGAGIFTAAWFLGSVLISLFASSYFAARISNFASRRIGAAQAGVVTAVFFGLLAWQSFGMMGTLTQTAGSLFGSAASVVGTGLTQNQALIGDLIEDNMDGLTLKSDLHTVVTGVSSRLLRGDTESAKNYLARQAGLTPEDADARVNALNARLQSFVSAAKEKAATALQASGWSLFSVLILGLVAAVGGGILGSRVNTSRPMTEDSPIKTKTYRAAYAS